MDDEINQFAAEHRLEVTPNYHNTPNRMLMWTNEGIERVIQITLYGDRQVLLAISAFRDEQGKRLGKRWPAKTDIPLSEFKNQLKQLLSAAFQTLQTVSEADMEYWS